MRAAAPGWRDQFAEAVITGTAVARFAGQRRHPGHPSLAVLPLDASGDSTHRPARARHHAVPVFSATPPPGTPIPAAGPGHITPLADPVGHVHRSKQVKR